MKDIPKKTQKKMQKTMIKEKTSILEKKKIHSVLLFFGVMGCSFLCTLFIIRFTPSIVKQVKQLSKIKLFVKKEQRKVEFSGNENYLYIEPILLREYIDTKKQKIIIIDTRSKTEYENGHIKNAVSVPLYSDFKRPYESIQDQSQWNSSIKKAFRGMNEIILYGYRSDADLLLVAVESLRKGGIKAKILSVGYGEWQGGFWNWIPGGELNGTVNINDYIEKTINEN